MLVDIVGLAAVGFVDEVEQRRKCTAQRYAAPATGTYVENAPKLAINGVLLRWCEGPAAVGGTASGAPASRQPTGDKVNGPPGCC